MSDYYLRLPALTELTVPQQAALDEPGLIALTGGPGTGKSIVSVWRHIRNTETGKRCKLLTYTRSLASYLRNYCRQSGAHEAMSNIGTSYMDRPEREPFDEIIIDEAQDLPPEYHSELISSGYSVSYGADDSQILYRNHSTPTEQLRNIFPDNTECVLDRNFRCTQNIMLFARRAFPSIIVDNGIIEGLASNPGPKPVVAQYSMGNILHIVRQYTGADHNIGILIQWQKDVMTIYDFLRKNGIDCSCYANDDGQGFDIKLKNVHVSSYRSAKGLEFDTVILPEFDYFYGLVIPFVNPDYADVISEEDIYVAVTRARSNLFLLNKYGSADFIQRFEGLILSE